MRNTRIYIKTIMVLLLLAAIGPLFLKNAYPENDHYYMNASERLADRQMGLYSSNWVISSVLRENDYTAALNNVQLRNEIENNLSHDLEAPDIAPELKGPKKSGGEEVSMFKFISDGNFDFNDSEAIGEILRGENPEYSAEEFMHNFIAGLEAEGFFREGGYYDHGGSSIFDFGFAPDGNPGGLDDYETLSNFFNLDDWHRDATIRRIQRAIHVLADPQYQLPGRNFWAIQFFILPMFDVPNVAVEQISVGSALHAYMLNKNNPDMFDGLAENSLTLETSITGTYAINEGVKASSSDISGTTDPEAAGNAEDAVGQSQNQSLESYTDLLKKTSIERKSLEEILTELESKEDRAKIENDILAAAQAVINDAEYIDNDTKRDFEEAVHLILLTHLIEDISPGVDFSVLSRSLENFTASHKDLYNKYLSLTSEAYRTLEGLLGIDIKNATVPDKYTLSPSMDIKAKRKIVIDLALKSLAEKEGKEFSVQDKKALEISENTLKPLQERYRKDLKTAMEKFILTAKKALFDVLPVSIKRDESQFKALFILDNQK